MLLDVLIPLFSAFGGAILGGFASAFGSHRVTLTDRVRDTRVEVYRELLPAVWHMPEKSVRFMDSVRWESLDRAARTCRKEDARFAATVAELRTNAVGRQKGLDVTRAFDPETGNYIYEDDEELDYLLEELVTTLQRWSRWLEQKLA